jgi:ABC-type multidrug transport system permease subunit
MTGYFYGEVMAPIKSCGRLCFFGVLVLLMSAMIKSKLVALLILGYIKLCSPRERWIGGIRNRFESVSFQRYLLEDA